jgi:hypothetical protein
VVAVRARQPRLHRLLQVRPEHWRCVSYCLSAV